MTVKKYNISDVPCLKLINTTYIHNEVQSISMLWNFSFFLVSFCDVFYGVVVDIVLAVIVGGWGVVVGGGCGGVRNEK